MDNQNMLSKTIGLHRTAIADTMAIYSTMHQHGEDILKTTLEQNPWLPKSSRDAYLYCADFYLKYLENLKNMADQGLAEIERISSPGLKPEVKKSQQTTTTERTASPSQAKKSPAVRAKKVRAKKTVAAKTLPAEKPVTPKVAVEKPVLQKTATEKPVTPKVAVEKPALQKTAAEKPVTPNVPVEKLVVQEKPEVKKSTEVKAAPSIANPSATNQTTTEPALSNKK